MLLVFFAATVIMVLAIVLVGAVPEWWVLVPVMLVDLAVTFAVIATLVWLVGHDGWRRLRQQAGDRPKPPRRNPRKGSRARGAKRAMTPLKGGDAA